MIRRLSHQTVQAVDGLLVIWLILAVLAGFAVSRRVNELGALGDGLIDVGEAISGAAAGLRGFSEVPLLGGGVEAIAEEIDRLGNAASDKGQEGKDAVLRLAIGIGILVALVPALPVLVTWGPVRLAWGRDRRQIREAIEAGDERIMAFLAHRAASTYPYELLAEAGDDPWTDLREGRYEAFASLELNRLGLGGPSS